MMLDVQGLHTAFETGEETVHAVRDVSFRVEQGKTLCLVGESGSGKSVTALSIMGLVAKPAGRVTAGSIMFQASGTQRAVDLAQLPPRDLQRVRGNRIAMIFQDPMTALNPYMKIGHQLLEVLTTHDLTTKGDTKQRISLSLIHI